MKIILGIIVIFLITSCASHQDKLSEYMQLSDRALCISYYERLVSGRNHPAKLETIEQRGIDCEPYKEEGLLAGKRKKEKGSIHWRRGGINLPDIFKLF